MLRSDSERVQSLGLSIFPIPLLLLLVALYVSEQDPDATSKVEPRAENPRSEQGEMPSINGTQSYQSRRWEDPLVRARDAGQKLKDVAASTDLSKLLAQSYEGDRKLLAMVVLVPGGAQQESVESRLRSRQAVESALALHGFKLAYPERITYFTQSVDVYFDKDIYSTETAVVPVKLYSFSDKASDYQARKVLTLWLDEDLLGERPLRSIAQVVTGCLGLCPMDFDSLKSDQRLSLAILGPSSTDIMLRFLAESRHYGLDKDCLDHFYNDWRAGAKLVSPASTVPLSNIWEFSGELLRDRSLKLHGSSDQAGVVLGDLGVAFSIGDDVPIVDALIGELKRRGAWPSEQDPRTSVLLIGDTDTAFARSLVALASEGRFQDRIFSLPYSAGIGSELPDAEPGATDHNSEGRIFRDYFRRSVDRLLNDLQHGNGDHVVRAIGVFGSTTQDKKYIIESLKPAFPAAVFFTSDLDARFADPSTRMILRNVVVASHYGLSVRVDGLPISNQTPQIAPFRGSYQASRFVATLVAVRAFLEGKLAAKSFPTPPDVLPQDQQDLFDLFGRYAKRNGDLAPRLFEVSNSGFFQFRDNTETQPHPAWVAHPPGDPPLIRRTRWWSPLVSAAAVALVLFVVLLPLSAEVSRLADVAKILFGSLRKFLLNVASSAAGVVGSYVRSRPAVSNDPSASHRPEGAAQSSGPERQRDSTSSPADTTLPGAIAAIWWCLGVTGLLVLVAAAIIDDAGVLGEPVSLTAGISCWPSIWLFGFIAFSAGLLTINCWNAYGNRDSHVRRILMDEGTPPEARLLIRERLKIWNWCLGAVALIALFLMVAQLIGDIGGQSRVVVPGRSMVSRWVGALLLDASWLLLLANASQVLYIGLVVRAYLDDWRSQLSFGVGLQEPRLAAAQVCDDSLAILNKVGMTTHSVSKLILGPAALSLLYAIARLRYWDHWEISVVSLLIIMLPLTIAVVVLLLIRRVANRIRENVNQAVQQELLTAVQGNRSKHANLCRERQQACADVKTGALGSIYNDPLLGGVALLATTFLTGPFRVIFGWLMGGI